MSIAIGASLLRSFAQHKGDVCIHRMLRSQSFVKNADADLHKREEKATAALSALMPRNQRHLTSAEAQAFYDRLLEDSQNRTRNR